MAIYVPPSTKRRRLVLLVAAGLVVGLLVGFLVGRGTASGVDDAVAKVRDEASDAGIGLQRLPIEYEQARQGAAGESTRTITEAIARSRADLDDAWGDASWFGPEARGPVDAALEDLDRAVEGEAPTAEFEAKVGAAVDAIEAAFGVRVEGAG
jgi:hypothetical protein